MMIKRLLFTCYLICIYTVSIKGQCTNNVADTGGTVTAGAPGIVWTNATVTFLNAADDNVAICASASGFDTRMLTISNFDFSSIPLGSTITGLEARIHKRCSDANTCTDNQVTFRKASGTESPDLSSPDNWPITTTISTYGGCPGIAGFTTLTLADVTGPNFGILFKATANAGATISVDMVQITVYYTPPPSTTARFTSGAQTTGEAPPQTTGAASPLTTASDTASDVTTSRATTGRGGLTTGSASRVTTGRIGGATTASNSAPVTTSNAGATTDTSTDQDRSGSTDGTMYIIYGVLGGVGFILIVVIVALLAVFIKRRPARGRKAARMVGLSRGSASDEEMNALEAKRELPDVDEKDLPVDIHKIGEKIEKLDKPIDFPGANGYSLEFNHIEKKTGHHGATEDYSAARAEANYLTKNRFRNVLPPEKTRVKLAPIEGVDGSDYINANYLSGLVKGSDKAYIATQGPLPATINDFWRMVWEQNTSVVLNLTREFENGRQKSERYWPEGKQPYETADFKITLQEEIENYSGELVTRKLLLTKKGKDSKEESRTITQFHYIGWPDHGVPEHTDAYIQLAEGADNTNATNGPIVVHCSAGIGRTGTFITIHSLLELIKEKLKENKTASLTINIPDVIIKLREQRSGMVQTPEQYEFTYHAIRDVIDMYLDPKKKEEKENRRKKLEEEAAVKRKEKEEKEKEEKAALLKKEKEEKEKAEAKEKEEKEKEGKKEEGKKEEGKKDEHSPREKKNTKRKSKKEAQAILHSSSSNLNESTKSTDSTDADKKEKPNRPPRPPKKKD